MHISTRLAQLMRDRRPAVGMWINMGDPALARIAVAAGYDWMFIDTEHNPLTEADVRGLIFALGGADVSSVVRVRANREEHIKWVLDCGAGGVMIPGVGGADDVRHAVSICKYHPLGMRGYGPNLATDFFTEVENYNANANQNIVLICQIELAEAVDHAEEICGIPGLDAIWIGPTDLAQSLGHLGNPAHPDVQVHIDKIIDAAQRAGMPWGIPTTTVEDYQRYVDRGATVMTLGSDTRMLMNTARGLVSDARESKGSRA